MHLIVRTNSLRYEQDGSLPTGKYALVPESAMPVASRGDRVVLVNRASLAERSGTIGGLAYESGVASFVVKLDD
jgi:hypothetical protein